MTYRDYYVWQLEQQRIEREELEEWQKDFEAFAEAVTWSE